MKLKVSIFLLLISLNAYSQLDCSKFKIGKFQNIENGEVKTLIERDESFQIERAGDVEVKLKITWLNDCSYQLKLIEGNEAYWARRPKDLDTPDLIVRIISITDDSYFQEAKFIDEKDFTYKSTIKKIK